MKVKLMSIYMLMAMASVVSAATLTWDGGGGDSDFLTDANWVGDVAPVLQAGLWGTFFLNDNVVIGNGDAATHSTKTLMVSGGTETDVTLTLSGGSDLSGIPDFGLGSYWDNVVGRTAEVYIGEDSALSFASGRIVTGSATDVMDPSTYGNTVGFHLTGNGGSITISDGIQSNPGTMIISLTNMDDGRLTRTYSELWDLGLITHDGVSGLTGDTFADHFDVDVTGATLTAIPEPATLGMVAAFGGAILFIRRKLWCSFFQE